MGQVPSETVLSLWRGPVTIRRGPTMAQIAAEVAEKHGVTVAQLKGRNRRFKLARWEAMARIRAETSQSLPAIGRFLGGRDHTTVLHGVRAHNGDSVDQRQREAAEADLKAWREFGRPKVHPR